MTYPHQPGSPSFDGGDAYEAHLDQAERDRSEVAINELARIDVRGVIYSALQRCRKAGESYEIMALQAACDIRAALRAKRGGGVP